MAFTATELARIAKLLSGDRTGADPDFEAGMLPLDNLKVGDACRLPNGDIVVRYAEEDTPYSCGAECCGIEYYEFYVVDGDKPSTT